MYMTDHVMMDHMVMMVHMMMDHMVMYRTVMDHAAAAAAAAKVRRLKTATFTNIPSYHGAPQSGVLFFTTLGSHRRWVKLPQTPDERERKSLG